MNITGKVVAVMPARSGVAKSSGNEWMAQEYVIETIEQYPRRIVFEVFGKDRIQEFNIQYNELINVFIDINAQQWQQRWYNTIRAWKVERYASQPVQQQPQYVAQQPAPQPAPQPQYAQQTAQYVQQPQPAPQQYGDVPF